MCCSSKRVSKGSSLLGIRGSKLILDWKEVLAFLKMASLAFCKGLGFRLERSIGLCGLGALNPKPS